MNVLCQENVNVKTLAYIICILPWTVWTCPFWRNVNIFIEFWFLSFLSFVYLYLKWEWIQGNIPTINGRFKQITRVKIKRNSGVIQRRNSSEKERRNLGVKNEAEFGSKKRRISVNKLRLESFDFPGGANFIFSPKFRSVYTPIPAQRRPETYKPSITLQKALTPAQLC